MQVHFHNSMYKQHQLKKSMISKYEAPKCRAGNPYVIGINRYLFSEKSIKEFNQKSHKKDSHNKNLIDKLGFMAN